MYKRFIASITMLSLLTVGCATLPAASQTAVVSSHANTVENPITNATNPTQNNGVSSTNTPSTTHTTTSISASPSIPANLVPAVVSGETDGDTIHVTINGKDETIRMLLIDTPEDKKPGTPVEPFSLDAARYCASVMPVGKHIYLEEGKPGYTRDKYGRLLAFVYITPTDMYNEDVVKKGLARVAYIYPPNTQHLSELQADQSYAKSKNLGIWTIPGYVTDYGYNMSAVSKSSTISSTSSPTGSSGATGTTTGTSAIRVMSSTLSVYPGEHASITIHTNPGATGSIEVDYKSGPSHATGLGAQTADSSGNITWTWYVGKSTTPGNWKVVVTVGSKSITETLTVK